MTQKPYILKEEEIEVLIDGMVKHGGEETYLRMKHKVMSSIKIKKYLDDMLLDMYETLLIRARDMDDKDEDGKELKLILYQLASMMRILAHELYRKYIRMGDKRDNKRFLRLAPLNEDISSVQ